MEEEIELTILIPALNEEKTIEMVIQKAQKWIKENEVKAEILISNNNSTDRTKLIALKNQVRVVDVIEKGYGNALIQGIKKARGNLIIMGDADDSYNFLEIMPIYQKLKEGYDLVIGNRFYNMEKGAMKWSHKMIGTPFLAYLIKRKYGVRIKDVNSGLRGMNKEKIEALDLCSEGMEFASEMIIKAGQKKLKILEVPIKFYKDKRGRNSHLSTVRDGIRHVKVIYQKDIWD